MVQVFGKRGKKVPIILTSEMKEAIEALNMHRDNCLIDRENPYVFANSAKGMDVFVQPS